MAHQIIEGEKYIFNKEEARQLLSLVWGLYLSINPLWFEIRILGDKARSYWFKDYREAIDWLERNWEKHVFYGVLPREKFEESELHQKYRRPVVSGAARHVERAMFVFADIDYKEEVELSKLPEEAKKAIEKQGYYIVSESEDGELKAYFRKDDKKAIHVTKPGLKEFMEWLGKKLEPLGVKPIAIIDSGYGYHVYVKLSYDIDIPRWRRLQKLFINYLGGDPKTKDLARILRVASTYNPRFHPYLRRVSVAHYEPTAEIDPEELLKKLQEIASVKPGREAPTAITIEKEEAPTGRRRLSDQEIEKAVEVLQNYWVTGHRDNLLLGLIGWMWKSRIDYESAYRLIKRVCEVTSDEDEAKNQARTKELERQWKHFESGAKGPEEILGKAGVLEELERIIKEQNPG